MKESSYAPKFEKLVKSAGGQGISVRELCEAVQSSREQAYQWARSRVKAGNLREIGENGKRAKVYVWQEASTARARTRAPGEGEPGEREHTDLSAVEVGSSFQVTALRFVGGRTVAVLSGPGVEIEAELT